LAFVNDFSLLFEEEFFKRLKLKEIDQTFMMALILQIETRKEVTMNHSIQKSLVFSLALALVLTTFFSVQAYSNSKDGDRKININTASSVELQELPHVGEKVAQRIIDFREQNGKFKKVEEIMKVRGIGEKTFEKIKDLITVGE